MNESITSLYDVWRIAFEYEDQPGVTKERPVIIGAIDKEFALALVMKVTSYVPRSNYPGEVPLEDWKDAGLEKPSVARCSKNAPHPPFLSRWLP